MFKLSDWDSDDKDGLSGDSDTETAAGTVKSKKSEIKVSKWISS